MFKDIEIWGAIFVGLLIGSTCGFYIGQMNAWSTMADLIDSYK